MTNVVALPRREPLYWRCACGCMSFNLRDDGAAECAGCGEGSGVGGWRERLREVDAPEDVTPFDVVTGLGRAATLAFAKTAKFVLAADGHGKIKTWSAADAHNEWVRAILRDAADLYPEHRSDDDEIQPEPDESQG